MIKVILVSKDGRFLSLEASGHADSAPYGADLICAAISAIVVGGLNALADGDGHYEATVKEGYVKLVSLIAPSKHDEIVLSTIVTQIESVASSYPKNVTLERK